ncbi:molybdopterin-guanine dinucleotide biosynthesis protein B [Arcobacter sp. F155]|uniref:molybdopterin-guanine dinucleotide biosynthesis protein B n=1 Tax=Arcobacteraceae TaxID=2808963 RepID=UPI00100B6AAE|nr:MULTISPECIES: molybdopterin-guanine dinucleotide biosynthesis protein B [unclassified Arcobacter]RXJ78914.1 molybdopterin-guanine dinucleotide biosynthesis protein B [Arcobacter sp. F155]RXK02752.1 molybdopterin-guanine dinucleotide biosynthesis protein B [Arcobacter sp. CECT 8989]
MNNQYKKLAVAFSGPSNSGKTTLIIKVSTLLQEMGHKVCIVKHDPGNKATFDIPKKDSYRFFETGADVAVVSPKRTTYFKNETSSIDEIIETFKDFDYLLVEGLKTLPLPRITIFRDEVDESYFKYSNSIAFDETINENEIPSNLDKLDLNNPEEIINWIENNAKRV